VEAERSKQNKTKHKRKYITECNSKHSPHPGIVDRNKIKVNTKWVIKLMIKLKPMMQTQSPELIFLAHPMKSAQYIISSGLPI
jgi:hypothetical protein